MPMKHAVLWALGVALVAGLSGVAGYLFLYEGSVAVYVKDAPGVWSHVNVTFSMVEIHRSGMGNATWESLTLGTRTVDLVALTNLTALIGSGRLGPGHYEQIRIMVISASAVDITGKTWTVNVTNGDLKIVQQFDLRSNAQTNIVLDIDLTASIRWTGSAYVFTPVIGSVTVG
jgi:uncharacterized protein DUF4382